MTTHTRDTLYWVLEIEHSVADILFEIEDIIGQAINHQSIKGQDLEASADFLLQAIRAYMESADLTHLHLRYVDNVAGKVDFFQLSRTLTPHLSVDSNPPDADIRRVLSALTTLAAQVKSSACDGDATEVFRQHTGGIQDSPIQGVGSNETSGVDEA